MSYECVDCNRSFNTDRSVLAHCKAKAHECYNCELCGDGNIIFKNDDELDEHMEDRHEECENCNTVVVDYETLCEHYRYCFAPGNQNSAVHQVNLSTQVQEITNAGVQHVQHLQAHQTYRCNMCDKSFKDEFSLNQHLRDSPVHKQVIIDNTFCSICEQRFNKPEDLQRHNSSPVHRDRNTPCILGCPSKFKTPSGLAQHVESSCEQSPLNRHHITAAVQSLNIAPKISLRSIEGSVFMPGTSRPLIEYQPLESSFNGHGYQCPICDQTFHALHSLEAHVNSPAHDEDEFKCPKCNTHFTLISGLVQHLESASCGSSNITDVERRFAKMTEQFSGSLKL